MGIIPRPGKWLKKKVKPVDRFLMYATALLLLLGVLDLVGLVSVSFG